MKVILIVAKTFLGLEKGCYIDLFSASKKLAGKYKVSFDNESRIKQIVIDFGDASFSVFSTGAIIIRSSGIEKNQSRVNELKKDLSAFVFSNKV